LKRKSRARSGFEKEKSRQRKKEKLLTIVVVVGKKLPDAEQRVKGPRFRVDGSHSRVEGVEVAADVAGDQDADRRGGRRGIRRGHFLFLSFSAEEKKGVDGRRRAEKSERAREFC